MSVQVKGLKEALKNIESKSEAIQKEVIQVLSDTAAIIEIDAKRDAPFEIEGVELGLKDRITKKFERGGLYWNVGINATQDYDAYVEFSTGLDARQVLNSKGYTPEMRAIAERFYKNGQGTLRGKPFLFPAFIKHTANLVKEMREAISKISK